jgi:hypothetical protein
MDGSGEVRLPQRHVTELSSFFAAHDRHKWDCGHARKTTVRIALARREPARITAHIGNHLPCPLYSATATRRQRRLRPQASDGAARFALSTLTG